jgi:hypothetical protein
MTRPSGLCWPPSRRPGERRRSRLRQCLRGGCRFHLAPARAQSWPGRHRRPTTGSSPGGREPEPSRRACRRQPGPPRSDGPIADSSALLRDRFRFRWSGFPAFISRSLARSSSRMASSGSTGASRSTVWSSIWYVYAASFAGIVPDAERHGKVADAVDKHRQREHSRTGLSPVAGPQPASKPTDHHLLGHLAPSGGAQPPARLGIRPERAPSPMTTRQAVTHTLFAVGSREEALIERIERQVGV